MQLYRFLVRRTESEFNKVVLKRLFMSKTNRPPLSVSKLASFLKGKSINRSGCIVAAAVYARTSGVCDCDGRRLYAGGQAGRGGRHRYRRCAYVRGAEDAYLCAALHRDGARSHHQGAEPAHGRSQPAASTPPARLRGETQRRMRTAYKRSAKRVSLKG
eukprot:365578-Chlamydomonas_euryale.AAC.12